MAIRHRLLELEQRLKQLAGESAPREPLEIRQAVLQSIVDMAQPAGRGRRVMPFDRVGVDVLAPTADVKRVFEAVFARDEGLDAAVRRGLAAIGCEPGADFRVDVTYRKRPLASWGADQRFAVSGHVREPLSGVSRPTEISLPVLVTPAPAAPAPVASASSTAPTVQLKVVKGRATKKTLELRADRINIGRLEEVTDRDQRLLRRNHVVFVEGDEIGDSVSRAHAHIRWTPPGEFRVRDDHSAYGTRIVRDGRTIDVAAGNSRGVRLLHGDELHLGRAVMHFSIVEAQRGET